MAKKNVNKKPEGNQAVGEAVTGVESYLKKNGKTLSTILIIILVAVCGYMAYNNWVVKPQKAEAHQKVTVAENFFKMAQYEQTLNGDGTENGKGLIDIIDQYGHNAGEGAYFMAGVSQLQLKNYNEAINYLKQYRGKDKDAKARALSCIGDAYVGLENHEEALAQYRQAIKISEESGKNVTNDEFTPTYLMKAAGVAEELGRKEEALAFYQEIKDKYSTTLYGMTIDKYISRINAQ